MYVDVDQVINLDVYATVKDISTCPICTGIVINATQCNNCENCFCRSCIQSWTLKSKTCPMCKTSNFDTKEASRVVKNMI